MAKLGDSLGRYCYNTLYNHSLVFTDIADESEGIQVVEPTKDRRKSKGSMLSIVQGYSRCGPIPGSHQPISSYTTAHRNYGTV